MTRSPHGLWLTLAVVLLFAAPVAAQETPDLGLPESNQQPGIPDPFASGDAGSSPAAPPTGGLPGADGFDPVEFVGSPNFAVGLGIGLAGAAMVGWLAFRGGAKFITSENVLDNETRYTIYQYLRDHPGSHLRELASTLTLSTTNALWHLRKLEDADLIRNKKVDGYKVFYPIDEGIEGKRKAIANAALKKENAKGILEFVALNPGTHQREMARALEVNHGTVRWHLRKMVDAGILIQMKRSHATLYYLTEMGTNMAMQHMPVEMPTWATEMGGGGMAEA